MTATKTRLREITVNGARVATGVATLADLVAERGFGDMKVATAVNGEFVAARRRAETPIAEGDRFEIVSARQGG